MRVFLYLEKNQNFFYLQNHLQAAVYSLFKESGFGKLHDLNQTLPRFFNFSQLYQTKKKGLTFIISSPIRQLIKNIYNFLQLQKGYPIKIGKISLKVKTAKILRLNFTFNKPIILKTETPVIIRVPKEKYEDYQLEKLPYPYFYWRPLKEKAIPFEPFIKQLEARVYKQYKLFTGQEKLKEKPIFSRFIYKKTLDLPYFKNGQKISRIGTLWELEVAPQTEKKLISFILDVGLGELNSQGYGFVNLVRR